MKQQAVDLMMGAPTEATLKQLRELHFKAEFAGERAGIMLTGRRANCLIPGGGDVMPLTQLHRIG
jgi:hypothetical protein